MKNYIHRTLDIGIVFNTDGTLYKVLGLQKLDKVTWEGVRHHIPFYEDELKKEEYVHYVSTED